jgi:hypothetical protein
MITQGADGISRGRLKESVGLGSNMLSYIPLHLSAFDWHEGMRCWLQSWIWPEMEILSPDGWYGRGHDHDGGVRDRLGFWRLIIWPGVFVWAPPQATAEAALDLLRRALIKRQQSTHAFICPRLFFPDWPRLLHKASDLVVLLPPGIDKGWTHDMLEHLTIGFVFPFLRCQLCRRKGTPKMLHLRRTLPGMWNTEVVDASHILRELFQSQSKLSNIPER